MGLGMKRSACSMIISLCADKMLKSRRVQPTDGISNHGEDADISLLLWPGSYVVHLASHFYLA